MNVLSEAVKANVKRFVYVASASAYGISSKQTKRCFQNLSRHTQRQNLQVSIACPHLVNVTALKRLGFVTSMFLEKDKIHIQNMLRLQNLFHKCWLVRHHLEMEKHPVILQNVGNVADGNMLRRHYRQKMFGEVNVACGRSADLNDLGVELIKP